MKRLTTSLMLILMLMVMVGNVTVAWAAEGDDPAPRPRRGGVRGEVTAVDDTSVTILTLREESVVVQVTAETHIQLVEVQSPGSLSDIEIGDRVGVRGRRTEDGVFEARVMIVAPPGDFMRGKVAGVAGETISVENRRGEGLIVTGPDTEFRVGREAGSLTDVTEDRVVVAFGEIQEDGSLMAQLVIVRPLRRAS